MAPHPHPLESTHSTVGSRNGSGVSFALPSTMTTYGDATRSTSEPPMRPPIPSYSFLDDASTNRSSPPLDARSVLTVRSLRSRMLKRSRSHLSIRKQQAKAELYSKQLDKARLKGAWHPDRTGQQAQGKDLGWSELIRKYVKHNPDHSVTPKTAAIEQQLRSTLESFYRDDGYTDLSHEQDDALPGQGSTLFPPPLPADGQGQGWSGPNFEGTTAQLEGFSSKSSSDDGVKQGITAIHAHALLAMGNDEDAVALLHDSRFLETVNTDQVRPEEQSDQYQIALFMLGFVTYGMANERLHQDRPTSGYLPFAYAGYARAIELHEQVRGGKRASALPGLPEDEIERWAETALYRNALLSVREGDIPLGLNALRAYYAHIARWPSDFRLVQRNVINRTYLRLLNKIAETGQYIPPPAPTDKSQDDWRSQAYQRAVVAAVAARVRIRDYESERAGRHGGSRKTRGGTGLGGVSSRTVSTRRPNPLHSVPPPSILWSNELQTVSATAAATVQRSSEFPRAGRVNVSALLLADELVKGWRLNGEPGEEYADDVVESLYTLTRLTFHSQRISRHLFTLLTAAQAYDEARCALELYVSIVDKAKEGDAAGSAALVEESKIRAEKQEAEGYDLEEVAKKEKEEEEKPEEEKEKVKSSDKGNGLSKQAKESAAQVLIDADDDGTIVNTLLTGAYVLLKYLGDAAAANAMATKALDMTHSDKPHGVVGANKEHLAKAKRIAGQCRGALSTKDPNPAHLKQLQQEALHLLREAVELDSQSSEAWYELAFLQAQLRQIPAGIRSVRKAIELEPADVRCWHLLTLLVSSQKDYKAAFQLAEVALDQIEQDAEVEQAAYSNNGTNGVNGVTTAAPSGGSTRTTLLSVDFPPSRTERAASILQLMITQNALEEIISGTEVALESQKESFAFFHENLAEHIQPTRSGARGVTDGQDKEPTMMLLNGNAGGNLLQFQANGIDRRRRDFSRKQGSLSGMGQSGATGERFQSLHRPRPVEELSVNNGTQAPLSSSSATGPPIEGLGPEAPNATPAQCRLTYQARKEVYLLSTLWLMSAATLRRGSQIPEARIAIQEAEKLDSGRSDVWIQLSLLFEKQGDLKLAINSLYKALACEADSVSASVHLARMFLSKEDVLASTSSSATTPSPISLDQPTPVSQALDTSRVSEGEKEGSKTTKASSLAQAKAASTARDLSALSLAEGLLTTVTSSAGKGWDCPEAWLYLGQVHTRTDRRGKARECLKFALELEESKPIRGLETALL